MKVGSLVERVKRTHDSLPHKPTIDAMKKAGYRWPEFDVIYTVRAITECGGGILLEEIVNPELHTESGLSEIYFGIKNFREIQPPMSLEEIYEMQHPLTLLQS